MRILALNPYHGGSHRAFLTGWMESSAHQFTMLTLPPYKWKWRMRHAAVTFAAQVAEMLDAEPIWDALFCTDMMNLAEFRGLAPAAVQRIPAILYFHENQLTYPSRSHDERDLHFAFTNMISAASANTVWFNSQFHREEFLGALSKLLGRMPDNVPVETTNTIRSKSNVLYPGIEPFKFRAERRSGPMRILWASRWEHDKDPQTFFDAIELLLQMGVDFRLNILGESFSEAPVCFAEGRERFASRVDSWGYLDSREEYCRVLRESDVVVSTAKHEFFGIAMVEAVASGCWPLAPRRLAYPEVLRECDGWSYDGTSGGLAREIAALSSEIRNSQAARQRQAQNILQRFGWSHTARQMDEAVVALVESRRGD